MTLMSIIIILYLPKNNRLNTYTCKRLSDYLKLVSIYGRSFLSDHTSFLIICALLSFTILKIQFYTLYILAVFFVQLSDC